MSEPAGPDDPKPPGAPWRDAALLVLVGAALGLTHNFYMLQNGPGKGLAWIKEERKVVRLDDLMPAPAEAATSATAAPAGSNSTADPKAAAPTKPATKASEKGIKPGSPTPAPASSSTPAPAASAPPVASTPPAATSAPATSDAPVIPESREPMETGLAIVRKLYEAKAAVFVDARTAAEYADGHIAGAVSLPFDDVFKKPDLVQKFQDQGLPIVCYCGGGDCDLSRNLAFSFLDAGKKRVIVYLGGLPDWKNAALPVNTGTQP